MFSVWFVSNEWQTGCFKLDWLYLSEKVQFGQWVLLRQNSCIWSRSVVSGQMSLLRVSVRRQVACLVTERRTGGDTTVRFNSHRAYAVTYITPWLVHNTIYTSRWTNLLNVTCLVGYTLVTFLSHSYRFLIALRLTFKLAYLIYFLVYIQESSESIHI